MNVDCDCCVLDDDGGADYCGQVRKAILKKDYNKLRHLLVHSETKHEIHTFQTFVHVCKLGDYTAIELMMQNIDHFNCNNEKALYTAINDDNKRLLQLIMSHKPNMAQVFDSIIRRSNITAYGYDILKLCTEDSLSRRVLKLMYRLRTGVDADTVGWCECCNNKNVCRCADTNYDKASDTDQRITDEENKDLALLQYLMKYNVWTGKNIARFKWLLRMNADVNAISDSDDTTPLMLAIKKSSNVVVTMLIDAKANVNARDDSNNSPLMMAIEENRDDEVIMALIDAKADVSAKGSDRSTPLMLAVKGKSDDVTIALIDAKANVNAKGYEGDTALLLAIHCASDRVVTALIDAKADVEARDPKECTALMTSIDRETSIAARALINAKANVTAQSVDGDSALAMVLHMKPSVELITLLIDAKADVNSKDVNGDTPLFIATYQIPDIETEIITTLLAAKADVNIVNRYGNNILCALHSCVVYNPKAKEQMELLLDSKADPMINGTSTSLIAAVSTSADTHYVKRILEANVDVNFVKGHKVSAMTTLLHNLRLPYRCNGAEHINYAETALALIEAKADLKTLTKEDKTLLLNECDEATKQKVLKALEHAE